MKTPVPITKFAKKLIGNPTVFPLKKRIFHGINLITVLLLLIIILVNTALRLYDALAVLFIIMITHFLLFYISRYKNKFITAIIGMTLIGYCGMVASFFNKSGIDGPAVFISFFISQLLITVISNKYHLYILFFNFFLLAILFFIQFKYNSLIKYIYVNPADRIVDNYFTFIFITVSLYFVTRVLSDNYNNEKRKAEQQADYITNKLNDLQKTTREREKLFSLVFHDLRNPLSSIQYYLEQFKEFQFNEEDNEEIRNELLTLTKSTSAMLETILIWLREKENAMLTHEKEIDIQDVIVNAIATELPFAHKCQVNINYNIRERMPVKTDPVIILLLLRTLISNAVKFSNKNESVTITTERKHEDYVVKVMDRGIGIKEEDKSKIFTTEMPSFYSSDKEKGFGIGLVLAKQFAERQGIKLGFESKYGTGSTFYFFINQKTT
ncbi:MAG: HAMP domain-containing sensor histidine kinase [Arachidicoccus sp.]|nr:HAMP domain-containing sensor histidine kinase [Arachidicoccus sp.]